MTIGKNSDYVLAHPFTKRAIRLAYQGKLKDLKFIFDLLQIDTYQEVAGLCTRAYRANKKENYPEIEKAIREIEPPLRLSAKLPIPMPECKVVSIKLKRGINPNQLLLDFTKKERVVMSALSC